MIGKKIKIVEVGPRDGLQNEKMNLDIFSRVTLIDLLSDSGLESVEVGSFVSPKWVPQMKDTDKVFKKIKKRIRTSYPVLVPNNKGLEEALKAKVSEIAIFVAASEEFSKSNINCSISESLKRSENIIKIAKSQSLKIRGYISTVLGCPFQGKVDIRQVCDITQALYELGCYEISLGDTIGVGTPRDTLYLLENISKTVPPEFLAGHFHDTYGQALANIYASVQFGVTTFDSSISGLGGCPFAKGATGNVPTEDLLYMLNGLNIETNVNMEKLLMASSFICNILKRNNLSRAAVAIINKSKIYKHEKKD